MLDDGKNGQEECLEMQEIVAGCKKRDSHSSGKYQRRRDHGGVSNFGYGYVHVFVHRGTTTLCGSTLC